MYYYFLYAMGHEPRSLFSTGASGMMLKSKMSTGKPIVVHAFGMSTIPAMWP